MSSLAARNVKIVVLLVVFGGPWVYGTYQLIMENMWRLPTQFSRSPTMTVIGGIIILGIVLFALTHRVHKDDQRLRR